jgi:hypothetical protein
VVIKPHLDREMANFMRRFANEAHDVGLTFDAQGQLKKRNNAFDRSYKGGKKHEIVRGLLHG